MELAPGLSRPIPQKISPHGEGAPSAAWRRGSACNATSGCPQPSTFG